MENKIIGSCHCGSIQFEIKEHPRLTVNCHCDECKRRNGGAFSTYMAVPKGSLIFTGGEKYLKQYKVEAEGEKYFCSECGSPIYNDNYRIPGMYMMFYGAFSNPIDFPPSINVFCSSKHDWVDNITNIKSFQESIER